MLSGKTADQERAPYLINSKSDCVYCEFAIMYDFDSLSYKFLAHFRD